MPYNNTPIAPSKEVSGQVSLPLARVQKIINADPERLHTSKNAAFAIALATELFIQHFSTATHNVVKAETKKPRRNVQYRDVATAVAKTDNLEFLVDVVPKTVLYKEVRKRQEERKEKEKGGKGKEAMGAGAMDKFLADGKRAESAAEKKPEDDAAATEGGAEAMDVDEQAEDTEEAEEAKETPVEESEVEEDGAAMQIEMEMRGPRANGKAAAATQEKAPSPKAPSPKKAPEPKASSPKVARSTRSSGFTAINGAK